ncbi:type III secretion system needle tip complex Bsp22 [Melaminivora jejuensis]
MDIETALLAVQSQRASLLEDSLKEQITSVQNRNNQISRLNELLGQLNKAAAGMPSDAKAGDAVKLSPAAEAEIRAAAAQAGIGLPAEFQPQWDVKLKDGSVIKVDEAGKKEAELYKERYWAFRSNDYSGAKAVTSITQTSSGLNKGELDGFIQKLKGNIDSLSNSQQMDMLRLQSMSNKRNEAFEIMTNFIKKMQDSRNSIIGNMR